MLILPQLQELGSDGHPTREGPWVHLQAFLRTLAIPVARYPVGPFEEPVWQDISLHPLVTGLVSGHLSMSAGRQHCCICAYTCRDFSPFIICLACQDTAIILHITLSARIPLITHYKFTNTRLAEDTGYLNCEDLPVSLSVSTDLVAIVIFTKEEL